MQDMQSFLNATFPYSVSSLPFTAYFASLVIFSFLYLCVCSFFWMIETLSMKGLTLNCMDRKSEAYELVRQGLKVRVLSFILIFQLRFINISITLFVC